MNWFVRHFKRHLIHSNPPLLTGTLRGQQRIELVAPSNDHAEQDQLVSSRSPILVPRAWFVPRSERAALSVLGFQLWVIFFWLQPWFLPPHSTPLQFTNLSKSKNGDSLDSIRSLPRYTRDLYTRIIRSRKPTKSLQWTW